MPRYRISRAVKKSLDSERSRRRMANESDLPPLWEPDPENIPQQLAFASVADIAGFGGSAGSGKSDTILGTAIRNHKRSMIFRREAVQLQGLIDRSREILTGHGKFVGSPQAIWRDLPGDRQIGFGHCQHPGDEFKHQGRPKDFIGFDELPHFLERQFWSIIGWLRSEDPNQRCRVIAGFNPPTNLDEQWVYRLFSPWIDPKDPNPAKPGELRWRARIDGVLTDLPDGNPILHVDKTGRTETIRPMSWTFFPARLSDNRYYANSGYAATLQQLPEPLRSQLLYGDFSVGIEDDAWQVIPTHWLSASMERWRRAGGDSYDLTGRSPDVIAQDVAQGGADKTVNARKYGHWIPSLDKHEGKTTPDGHAAAKTVMRWYSGISRVYVDVSGGHGGSSYERLRDTPQRGGYGIGKKVYPINFGGASEYRDRSGLFKMANQRAEMIWRLRDALDPEQPGGSTLCLPDDPELLQDLAATRYEQRGETIQIEDKADIAKRIGRSPDCGDAVMMLMLPEPFQPDTNNEIRFANNPAMNDRGSMRRRLGR